MGFLGGERPVLHSLWNDEDLARPDRNASIPKANVDAAAENQKKIIRVVVLMPSELALHLDHHEVVPVELTDDAGLPVVRVSSLCARSDAFDDGGLPMSTCDIISSLNTSYCTARHRHADNYKLLTNLVVRCSIAWVSSLEPTGVINLAPFSFFNAVDSDPVFVIVKESATMARQKTRQRNIESRGEFAINTTEDLLEAMGPCGRFPTGPERR